MFILMKSVIEIANFLGVKESTIRAWVHTRQIPYYKIGRLVKFKLEEIEQWIQEKRVEVINYDG